jgi:hypothetical protein
VGLSSEGAESVNAGEEVAVNAINAAAATVGSAAFTKPWNMISSLVDSTMHSKTALG